MPDDAQAALIVEIGEMIVEDPRVEAVDWRALAFVATIVEGRSQLSGYRYDATGDYAAVRLSGFLEVIDKLEELRDRMQQEAGGEPWSQCLIQIQKPDYAMRMAYEYEDPERWRPKAISRDMREYAESLRPG